MIRWQMISNVCVRMVREAIGADVRLTVDSNGGWSVNAAIRD